MGTSNPSREELEAILNAPTTTTTTTPSGGDGKPSKAELEAILNAPTTESGNNAAPKPEQEEGPGPFKLAKEYAKGGVRGLYDTLKFVGDAGNYIRESLDPRVGPSGASFGSLSESEEIKNIDKQVGKYIDRDLSPQGPLREAIMAGSEFGGGAMVGPLRLPTMAADALLSGGGAAIGNYLTGGSGFGELGGGVAGQTRLFGLGGFLFDGLKAIGKIVDGDIGASDEAIGHLEHYADDFELAIQNAEKARTSPEAIRAAEEGRPFTLGQLSGDKGIQALEAGLMPDYKYRGLYDQQLTASGDDFANVVPEAEVGPLREAAKNWKRGAIGGVRAQRDKGLAAIDEETESGSRFLDQQYLDKTTGQEGALQHTIASLKSSEVDDLQALNLDALNRAAPEGYTITETGSKGGEQLYKARNAKFDEAWEGAEEINESAMGELQEIALDAKSLFAGTDDYKIVESIISKAIDVVAEPSTSSLRSLDKRIRNQMERAATEKGGFNEDLKDVLAKMRETIINNIPGKKNGKSFRERLQEAGKGYDDYLSFRSASTSPGAVKRGHMVTPEDLLLHGERIGGKTRGMTGGAPYSDMLDKMQETGLRTSAVKEFESGIDATFGATKAEADAAKKTFLTEQEEAAKALRQKTEGKVAKIEKTQGAKLAEVSDPYVEIKKAMGTGDKKRALKQITNIAKQGGPKAKAELKSSVYKYVQKELIGDKGQLKKKGSKKFEELVSNVGDIFSKKEIEKMRLAMKRSDELYEAAGIKKTEVPKYKEGAAYYASSILGLKVGKTLASGHPLFGAMLGRKMATEIAVGSPHKKALERLEDLLENPQNYKKDIEKMQNWNSLNKEDLLKEFERWVKAAGAIGREGTKEEE